MSIQCGCPESNLLEQLNPLFPVSSPRNYYGTPLTVRWDNHQQTRANLGWRADADLATPEVRIYVWSDIMPSDAVVRPKSKESLEWVHANFCRAIDSHDGKILNWVTSQRGNPKYAHIRQDHPQEMLLSRIPCSKYILGRRPLSATGLPAFGLLRTSCPNSPAHIYVLAFTLRWF